MLDNVLKAMKRELLEEIRNMLREELQQLKAETPKPSDEQLMDTKSVCALLKLSAPSVRKYRVEGHLKSYRIGSNIRFKRSEVESCLRNMRYLKHSRTPL